MKKFFLMAFIAVATITGCSDDDSSATNNPSDTILVKKTIESKAGQPDLISNYTYDGNRLMLIESSDNTKINFIYTDGKLTSIEYRVDGELEQRNLYTYDSQGRLAQLVELLFMDGDNSADRTTFTYNTNGTVNTKLYSGDHTSQNELVEEGVVTITNGNITHYQGSMQSTFTDTYDDKNAPEKNIFAVDILNLGWIEGGMNNITQHTGSGTGDGYTKTYTYNANNYPVTSSENQGGMITNMQYFYE